MNPDNEILHIYKFAEFQIDTVSDTLHRRGEKLSINRRTFGVLRLLVERAGHIVTKQEFFDTVWADTFVEDNSLTVAMTHLRKLLGDDPKRPRFIENLPRKGYRFIATVEAAPRQAELPPATSSAPSSQGPSMLSRRPVAALMATIVVLSLGVLAFTGIESWRSKAGSSRTQIRSVVVLPFENPDPQTEYLSDGLTDSVTNALAENPGLHVINRGSAFRYKGKEKDIQSIQKDLTVDAIVTGRMSLDGDSATIQAELTDVTTRRAIWNKEYTGRMSDISYLQRAMSGDLWTVLNSKAIATSPKRGTESPEAYQSYLKGLYFWNRRTTDDFAKGVKYFQEAIAADPAYANAYVGLANCYASGSFDYIKSDKERTQMVLAAANQALDIDPKLGSPYATRALMKTYYLWDWQEAESDYKRSIELEPNFATGHHWYGEFLAMQGRFDESLGEYERALELDPLSMAIRTDLGITYYYAGRYDAGIKYLEEANQIDPAYSRTHAYLSEIYRTKGMFYESIDEYEKYRIREGDDLQILTGKIKKLRAEFRKSGPKGYWQYLLRESLVQGTAGAYEAMFYAKLGERDKAFELLQRAYSIHEVSLVNLKVKHEYDEIRDDPRFVDLRRRVGLPD